jgi:hypothetical protein
MSLRVDNWHQRMAEGNLALGALEADLRDLEFEIEAGEAEIQERRAAVDALREDHHVLVGLRNFLAHATPMANDEPRRGAARVRRYRRGSKRDAIIGLLEDTGVPLPIGDIRDGLAASGDIEDAPGAYHSLQVTLSQMYRDGQLARPRQGIYELPRNGDEPSLASAPHALNASDVAGRFGRPDNP